ncbi:conserved hypothetical membrane protein [Paraglaciecola sp. T6c]|uniref:BatA domain-containing protein n=1 Tax=Pseudoalteromonas atlantica (strain T6c / ATCC BAA-1087) TaxID=3042615 RepID=UPI00005C633B|nr:BatA domain-containing protein [Paraglaciecola sp. T6c]ABG41997.1 conserved hypothetical membrane protein [Paraglaciecola sp. T6c]
MEGIFSAVSNTLLFPLWLLGMLTVAIPIGIHFFSKSKAPLISFAQYALIPVRQSIVPNALRLSQWLLLLLRMAILVLLSLLLAQCIKQTEDDSETHYFLVSQDWLQSAQDSDKQTLLNAFNQAQSNTSSRLILLSQRQNEASNDKALLTAGLLDKLVSANGSGTKKDSEAKAPLSIWQKVADFMFLHPSITPTNVHVFTTDRLSQFNGDKPAMYDSVDWHIVQIKNSEITPLKSSVLLLSSAKNQIQTQYLRAAFDALNTEKNREIAVDTSLTTSTIKAAQLKQYAWIFYLGDTAPSAKLAKAMEQYVQEGGQLFITATKQIVSRGRYFLPNSESHNVFIKKVGQPAFLASKRNNGEIKVVWQTADKQPLLSRAEPQQKDTLNNEDKGGQILTFYSRFEPNWTNWVTQADFPYTLDNVLNQALYQQQYITQGTVVKAQIASQDASSTASQHLSGQQLTSPLNPQRDQHIYYWLLSLFVCAFCLERVLSEYRGKSLPIGATS